MPVVALVGLYALIGGGSVYLIGKGMQAGGEGVEDLSDGFTKLALVGAAAGAGYAIYKSRG
jgi:hypothetical protein